MSMKARIGLHSGPWAAEVMPGQGMNVLALSCQGQSVLRTPTGAQALRATPFLYGTPLLFPAGRIRDGRLCTGGHCFQLPINEPLRGNHLHGRFFDAPFQVTAKAENWVQALYRNQDRTRFPLDMQIDSLCLLEEEGLTQKWTITNLDTLPLPISFALHTAFRVPRQVSLALGEKWELDERFCATGRVAEKSEAERLLSTGLDPADIPLSGMYEMRGPARLGRFLYRAQPPFDTWVVYNGGGGKGFLCVEPQCGIGLGVPGREPLCLAPGEGVTFQASLSIAPEESHHVHEGEKPCAIISPPWRG